MDVSLSKFRELVTDRAAWWAAVHGVTKSQTWLSDGTELNAIVTLLHSMMFYYHFSPTTHVGVLRRSVVSDSVTPWTVAGPAPLSMGFSRQEYWSGLPRPPPGDLPKPGINLCLLHLLHWQVSSLPLIPPDFLSHRYYFTGNNGSLGIYLSIQNSLD